MTRCMIVTCLLLPSVVNAGHPVDEILSRYQQANQLEVPLPISDQLFVRRASLDLVGLLPSPERVQRFLDSDSSDKRAEFVDELLADRRNYTEHWMTFWSDSLRNAYRGTGFIDNGRLQITQWLYGSLYHNKPFDQFVHELISPVPGSEGFTKGILWRGVVNESQRKEIQAAQSVAHVFMGANLKCASCHDSFVDKWLLTDAYGMAAVFADGPLIIHECEKPIDKTATASFFIPEVGTIESTATREVRMQQLADLIVDQKNKRFARTVVNRLWAFLMGHGLVHPVDNLDLNAPWSEELLSFLAADFVEHGYDLKQTLRLITTSAAYAMPTDTTGKQEDYVFRGPLPQRMTAEQFTDALTNLTGIQPQIPGAGMGIDGRNQGGQFEAALNVLEEATDRELHPLPDNVTATEIVDAIGSAEWIWSHADALKAAGGEQAWFRMTFKPEKLPSTALMILAADNEFELFVNGTKSLVGTGWSTPLVIDLHSMLRTGENVVALQVKNGASEPNPAGLLGTLMLVDESGDTLLYQTGADWKVTKKPVGSWKAIKYDETKWENAFVIAQAADAPWMVASSINPEKLFLRKGSITGRWGSDPVRAALLFRDDFQATLGRPNREQVVTARDSHATLLQALELTNGKTLDELLMAAAQQRIVQGIPEPDVLITDLYLVALSRSPSSQELAIAKEIVGEPMTAESIADLFWNLVMLPEFQIVY